MPVDRVNGREAQKRKEKSAIWPVEANRTYSWVTGETLPAVGGPEKQGHWNTGCNDSQHWAWRGPKRSNV